MAGQAYDVAVIMGSKSDMELVEPCLEQLRELGIAHRVRVASAHRTPEHVRAVVREAEEAGAKVFICAAGWAAHLSGVVASLTTRPVIAVPLATSVLSGVDALLASVQMPSGVPVATVAINGARNAAILAAQILAVGDEELAQKLREMRQRQAEKVLEADRELGG